MLDIAQNVTIDRVAAGVPGERPAVMSAGGTLCYAEFDAAANHIAEVLRAKGVERDECVAVIVPRSPELARCDPWNLARGRRVCADRPGVSGDTYSYDRRRERCPGYRGRNRIRRNG